MLKVSLSGDTRNYQWTKVSPKSEKQIFRERICNGDLFFLDFFLIDIPASERSPESMIIDCFQILDPSSPPLADSTRQASPLGLHPTETSVQPGRARMTKYCMYCVT